MHRTDKFMIQLFAIKKIILINFNFVILYSKYSIIYFYHVYITFLNFIYYLFLSGPFEFKHIILKCDTTDTRSQEVGRFNVIFCFTLDLQIGHQTD